ncbi:cysteine proteinase [Hypoxylon sp. FL1857]|nr:cysteine proteinase [Hypoxylon sp. FL1857]
MSSVASTRASIAPGTGAQGTMTSSANGFGGHASGDGSGSKRAPFRHIDDLVSVGVDLDPHTPLRKILELGDAHMRQATTYNDFRRPDLALQEYIKAFTIAVDKVPRHKDYPSMKSDRGDLNRLYNALKTKITSHGATFDQIKEDIKEDNRRSGVQPAASSKSSSERTRPISSGTLNGPGIMNHSSGNAGTGYKPKPPVQPKPQALHGNAIKQTTTSSPQDLASRFARLRESQKPGSSMKVADQSQPTEPAESALARQSLASLDTSMPAMPKLPEAIYSPARGTITTEVANLPSSAPRGMFSRTNSTSSAPTAAAWASTENAINTLSRNQFVTAHAYGAPRSSTSDRLRVPAGNIITPKALEGLLSQKHPKVNILIIDVRDRESFDDGHINAPGTICLEPEILMRENISADDITDSMVLAPSHERLAFEQRDKVDLVVIYDQSSSSVPTKITGDPGEMILYNLRQALSYYSYNRPLKHSPKLLSGGLNSWIYEFGEQFVEISNTAAKYTHTGSTQRNRGFERYRTKARTLSQSEIDQFEKLIKEDQPGTSEFDYIKTREDFIRRYPSITGAPESMTSLVNGEEALLAGMAPTPPRRPAPAIPRTRYSGLDSRDDEPGIGGMALVASAGVPLNTRKRTGLHNTGNICYCNSTIQALLASPGFSNEILRNDWPEAWRRPPAREPGRPQLLSKILKNVFEWLHKREFAEMKLTTLLSYLHSIHEGFEQPVGDHVEIHRLGDHRQHDIDELTMFMFSQLQHETNVTDYTQLFERLTAIPSSADQTVAYIAREYINATIANNRITFVDRHFSGFTVKRRVCSHCEFEDMLQDNDLNFRVSPQRSLARGRSRNKLEDLMRREWSEHIEGSRCQSCGGLGADVTTLFAKLPRLLRLYIRRYTFDPLSGRADKEAVPMEFPFTLDMAPFAWDPATRNAVADILGPNFNAGFAANVPTQYDLYAIQVHQGTSVNAGHYWAWIKGEGKGEWLWMNDHAVSSWSGSKWQRELQDLYNCPENKTPVQLFYKRRDIPYEFQM